MTQQASTPWPQTLIGVGVLLTGLALFLPPATVAGPGAVFAFYLYVCQLALIVALGVLASLRLRWGWRETLAHVRGLPPAPPSPP